MSNKTRNTYLDHPKLPYIEFNIHINALSVRSMVSILCFHVIAQLSFTSILRKPFGIPPSNHSFKLDWECKMTPAKTSIQSNCYNVDKNELEFVTYTLLSHKDTSSSTQR